MFTAIAFSLLMLALTCSLVANAFLLGERKGWQRSQSGDERKHIGDTEDTLALMGRMLWLRDEHHKLKAGRASYEDRMQMAERELDQLLKDVTEDIAAKR